MLRPRRLASALLAVAALAVAGWSSARAGSEQFRAGEAAFAEHCAACHGEAGRGGPGYANPIWGRGAQIAKFGNAAALFEYNQLMMPFDDPVRVSDEVKWAVTQFILARHGAMPEGGTLGPDVAAGIPVR